MSICMIDLPSTCSLWSQRRTVMRDLALEARSTNSVAGRAWRPSLLGMVTTADAVLDKVPGSGQTAKGSTSGVGRRARRLPHRGLGIRLLQQGDHLVGGLGLS